ncbi:hypothetical protein Q2T40_20475 [Winogradskyella maritima]|uniref:Outer membrane protein beta-barrel domain-containing protein n=1 Tax=Winogradskyella maritima TaxID=1517766 RepID=A0ABV8AE24_9FLAO|nr:hypothetical protein [Winogradskyella maritima]
MKNIIKLLFITLSINISSAQFVKEKAIKASIGYGQSAPYEDIDVTGSGFYAQGELVLTVTSWIDFRPYAGVLFTKPDEQENPEIDPSFKSTANAFMTGVKTRLRAPVPWVAPYFEFGAGLSVGSFETITANVNIDKSGVLFHVPISIGLEIGRNHNFDFGITFNYHNAAQQFSGATLIGLTFPID